MVGSRGGGSGRPAPVHRFHRGRALQLTTIDESDTMLRADAGPRSAAPAPRVRRTLRAHALKLVRYSATSAVALAVSEATLLLLVAFSVFDATADAFIGNLAGTIPSYVMSRYWIWRDAPRRRVGRQVFQYWSLSFVSMGVTSVATGAIARIAPGDHAMHLLVVGGGFFVVSFALWVAKYVVYERLIFRSPQPEPADEAMGLVAVADGVPSS